MRVLYDILSKDYGIIKFPNKKTKENIILINIFTLMMIIVLWALIIYIIYFSDDLEIKLLIS